MDVIVFITALVTLGALALRFGRDGREGIRSQEHEFAAHGVVWNDGESDRGVPAAAPTTPSVRPAYPTLAFIEWALGGPGGVLTGAEDANRLEARARALTAEYWGDAVWTTGIVSAAAFDRVLAELAPRLLAGGAPSHPIDLRTGAAIVSLAPTVQAPPADAAA